MTPPQTSPRRDRLRLAVLGLCFLSGFAGLVYEVVWMRMLTFVFGVSAYATATVLVAFMGGLALGSWGFRRLADEGRRPLRTYALLEAGIGVYALLLPLILAGLTPVYVLVHHLFEGNNLLVNLARFLLGGAALLLPATCMGATVPVLGRYFVRSRERIGQDAGVFYAVNTFGAVAGAFTAGFLLIGPLGVAVTTYLAIALNALVAAGALWVDSRQPERRRDEATVAPASRPGKSPHSAALLRWTLVVFAFSGFISLAYEVLWTRLLVFYLHNSTYAFSAMLVVFLFGLAAGSFVMARWLADHAGNPVRALGIIEFLIGFASLTSIWLHTWLPEMAQVLTRVLPIHSFLAASVLIFCQATVILLLPTLFMGAAFPLAARAVTADVTRAGHSLGSIYAINTLGTMGGAFLCGFVLIPALGLGPTAAVLVLANLALAAILLVKTPAPTRARGWAWVALLAATALLVPATVPRELFKAAFERRFARVLFYKDEATDTVAVAEFEPGRLETRTIYYADGRGTAGIFSVHENRISGHLPMLLHEDPQDVLVICFGVGNSLSAVGQHPASRIHCVELSPGVISTAHFFAATNKNILEDSRVKLFIEDGRIHLLTSPTNYDVVTLEPPEMHTAGVVNLYTREFYELVKKRLNPGGVVCQWLNIRKMPELEFKMLIQAFREVFPHTTLWQPPKCFGVLMLGTDGPLEIDLPRFLNRFHSERVYRDLAEVGMGDPYNFLSQLLMNEEQTAAYAAGVRPVTDNRTYVDFSVPRSVMADYAVAGFFAGLDLEGEIRDSKGRLTSSQAGYAKIRRMSRQRDNVLDILTGLDRLEAPMVDIQAAIADRTDEKRHWCDDYGR
ncbi:MAG: fused MFS/spermidine synthase [Acidobacteria bacterium]|nr:fused MFS/spermidine synthase [Acidobacteriota bacterium]